MRGREKLGCQAEIRQGNQRNESGERGKRGILFDEEIDENTEERDSLQEEERRDEST